MLSKAMVAALYLIPVFTVSAGADEPAATSRLPVTSKAFGDIVTLTSVAPYDDVRFGDMSALDFSARPGLVSTLIYNESSIWPELDKLGAAGDPQAIMEAGKNPGLGVRQLHDGGITGRGVRVAIIDQPMYLDHPEFAGKVAAYYDAGCGGSEWSVHGPAVASLLVGSTCGTAPEAILYFAAAPSWTADAAYQAQALDWIVEQNARLPQSDKIRVVLVSAAPSSVVFTRNNHMWDPAVARAEAAGILVMDCTSNRGSVYHACCYDAADHESVEALTPGFPGLSIPMYPGWLLAPASPRTMAEEIIEGIYSYQYTGHGGRSWAIPYIAGVAAMGWQVAPDLTARQMRACLFESAYVNADGYRFINPPELVRLAQIRQGEADPDGDGLSNNAEIALGTDPYNFDTDGDGLSDGVEIGLGFDPLVAEDTSAVPVEGASVGIALLATALSQFLQRRKPY